MPEQQNFNLYLEPRREMILASLWFPLFLHESGEKKSGKLVRTQQEQEAAARALPGTECCLPARLPTISRSTRVTAHPEL